METLNIVDRVGAGADWLDANFPDWFRQINVDTLDVRSDKHCVAGQLFGFYSNMPDALWSTGSWRFGLNIVPADILYREGLGPYGMAIPEAQWMQDYSLLTEEWRRVINIRLALTAHNPS